MSSIDNVLVRAAASSIASGSPSSERHSSWTRSSTLSSTWGARRRRCAAARRLKSSTASSSASGPSSRTSSPSTPKGTWLVQRTWMSGPASRMRAANAAAASTTCSQLSRTTKALLCRSRSNRAASPGTFERGDHRVGDLVGSRRGLESGQPRAARSGHRCSPRPRSARRLADTAGTDDLDQSVGGKQLGQHLELCASADELVGHRRQVSRVEAGELPDERGVVHEDLLLDLAQLWTGLETELVGQLGAGPVGKRPVRRLAGLPGTAR